jgi:hypothetical protein
VGAQTVYEHLQKEADPVSRVSVVRDHRPHSEQTKRQTDRGRQADREDERIVIIMFFLF